ncbi:MAG: hypothetical protein IKP73_17415 [Bacteroidales bacterium]|jgi:hypothetical protein|nr:hypothetical protein [Bacteroidales bacterium]
MKIRHLIAGALMMVLPQLAMAQAEDEQRTIFQRPEGKDCVEVGMEGGFTIGGGSVDGRATFIGGIEAGVIIGHGVELGLYGNGFVTEKEVDKQLDNDKYQFDCITGGVFVKPIIAYRSPVHISFPIKFGVGEVSYSDDAWADYDDHHYRHRYNREDHSVVCEVEPGARVEFNVTKNFHISVGVSYKFLLGHNLEYYDTKAPIISSDGLNSLFYGVSFSFGRF